MRRLKGVDRAVFAHGRPADGDYRSKVSEKLAKEGHGSVLSLSVVRGGDRGMLDSSLYIIYIYLTTGPQGLKGGVGGIYSFDSAPNTSSPRGMFCLSEDDQAIRLYCTHILPGFPAGFLQPPLQPPVHMNECVLAYI